MFTASLRHLFCAAVLLAPAAAAAQAQPDAVTTRPPASQLVATQPARPLANVVRADMLSALAPFATKLKVVQVQVGYERQLANRLSGAVSLSASSRGDLRLYNVTLQGRYYVIQPRSKQALRGMYLAPHISLQQLEQVYRYSPSTRSNQGGIGGQVGVQTSLGRHLVFDASTGLTALRYLSIGPETPTPYTGLFQPELQMSLGYAF